jgi:hypothetical protein
MPLIKKASTIRQMLKSERPKYPIAAIVSVHEKNHRSAMATPAPSPDGVYRRRGRAGVSSRRGAVSGV